MHSSFLSLSFLFSFPLLYILLQHCSFTDPKTLTSFNINNNLTYNLELDPCPLCAMATLPDHTPWYGQLLSPQYNYSVGGFAALTTYMSQQPSTNTSSYQMAPIVACYSTPAQRLGAINGALPADRPQYEAGQAVESAT
jgi:hypothetical protein